MGYGRGNAHGVLSGPDAKGARAAVVAVAALVAAMVALVAALSVSPATADAQEEGKAGAGKALLATGAPDEARAAWEARAGREAAPALAEGRLSDRRARIAASARRWLGHYYQWSWGLEPCPPPASQGIDCECLNRLAYYGGVRIQLPYTLYGQINRGRIISSRAALPGDLVFFDLNHNGQYGNARDHTGTYTGYRNGRRVMIHADGYDRKVQRESIAFVADWNNTRPLYVRILR